MKIIHSTPGYVLAARVTQHPITGKTVELFQTLPQAQHPRAQRIACLTLPQASLARLAALLTDKEDPDHAQT
jgi:hypothetical protein